MDLLLFNEFIEWIDTFNGWIVYLVINVKSITPASRRVWGLFVLNKNRLWWFFCPSDFLLTERHISNHKAFLYYTHTSGQGLSN